MAHYSCPSRQYSFCGRGASCAPCPAVPYSGWVRKPRFWIQQPKLCKVRNLVYVVSLTVMVVSNQTIQIAALKDHQMMLVFWSKLSPNFLIFMAFWLVQVRGGQLCEWSEAWRLQLGWCQRFRPEDRVRRRPNSRIPGMLIAHSTTNFSLEFFKALTVNYISGRSLHIRSRTQLFKLILAKKSTRKVASLLQIFTLPRFT